MKCRRLLAASLLIALPAVAMTGCNSAPAIRANMTPAADSATQTSAEDWNDYARINDHNTRNAWDDLSRLLLLEQSSRLSPWVIP
jgi:hypothetical protein